MRWKRIAKGLALFACVLLLTGGLQDRQSLIELKANPTNLSEWPEISAPSGTPATGYVWLYPKAKGASTSFYVEDDAGAVFELGATITATVELTNAQLKAIRATKVDLVAAPGAGYFLEFVGAVLILDYGSNVFTESADNLVIQYDGGQDATAAIEMTGFIDQSADTVAVIIPATIAAVASADVANDALELFNTGDGEFGGNAGADTTMTVKISYRVHATGL